MPHSEANAFYRLSPMQEGMLFHHLRARTSGVDIEQLVCNLHEAVQTDALAYAWRRTAERHAVMRTTFQWENSPKPFQTVQDRVDLSFEVANLESLTHDLQEQELERYLDRDRSVGFDLDRAPLMRVALFRLSEKNYKLVWSFHHAILDGRSFHIVLNEVFSIYDARRRGQELQLPPLRPYSDYISWLDTLDLSQAEAFWRNTLKGFSAATPLPAKHGSEPGSGTGEHEFRLSEAATESLKALAAREGITLNTIVQGAWALLLNRYSGAKDVVFGATRACRSFSKDAASMVGTFMNTLPVRAAISDGMPLLPWLREIRAAQIAVREFENAPLAMIQSWSDVAHGTPLFESILIFENYLLNSKMQSQVVNWTGREVYLLERTNYPLALYGYAEPGLILKIAYHKERFDPATITRILGHLRTLLEAIAADTNPTLADLPILTGDENKQLLEDWNRTGSEYARKKRIHDLIEEQTRRSPDAVAVIFRDRQITYRELDSRANQLARFLQDTGVRAEDKVGIFMRRSLDMMVALLAVMKAGGAYVPLDPSHPAERLKYILSDARVAVVLTQENLCSSVSGNGARVVVLDTDWAAVGTHSTAPIGLDFSSDNLAYVIYTSGTTGKPKGVMVRHRNVVNFFEGMDRKLGQSTPSVWLAVTSISFDISVLEMFWTLARGFRVILQEENYDLPTADSAISVDATKPTDISLFYFASDDNQEGDKYRLLLEGARFADQGGFAAIWTPERHFHAFGGLFPNPSVTSAALAMITKNLQIRAGSVVLPLHNPVRVAEEWAMVDQLSQGRVGISFAAGWHDRDFVFAPDNYTERKKIMMRDMETVRALWRGESIAQRSGSGKEVNIGIFPRPIQSELPVWLTAGGDSQTFRLAGEAGANLLTHLLGQTLDELKAKVAIYRSSFVESGKGKGNGHVTLMLHTFVGKTEEEVEAVVRAPFCKYLKSSVDLMRQVAKGLGEEFQGTELTEEDLAALIDHAFHRYFRTSGLFGTPETCITTIRNLEDIGVDEVACLIDFGIDSETVLANLGNLRALAARSKEPVAAGYSIPEQILRHRVTHMQCTPSLARIIVNTSSGRRALGTLERLLVGGEALPASLARALHGAGPKEVWNMYGPTETTIWSTMDKVQAAAEVISIGRAIANTLVFVLDERQRPVPIGVAGELYIGGEGVVRGYLNRPELTAEKFVRLPFLKSDELAYRTGDLVRYLPDGRLEFLGRLDHQVKIRGHRIELGEIEAALSLHPGIREVVVSATSDADEGKALVAYLTKGNGVFSPEELRAFLESKLPSYMVPNSFIFLGAFPLTPNGKIDRQRLPKPEIGRGHRPTTLPRNATELALAHLWEEALRVQNVGVHDNFFDLGGHSLTAVKITAGIRRAFAVAMPLQTVLDNPTIAQLSAQLEKPVGGSSPPGRPVPPPIGKSPARRRSSLQTG
jgi:natural product biosynthesis luciferase-like monooxygenase protein